MRLRKLVRDSTVSRGPEPAVNCSHPRLEGAMGGDSAAVGEGKNLALRGKSPSWKQRAESGP